MTVKNVSKHYQISPGLGAKSLLVKSYWTPERLVWEVWVVWKDEIRYCIYNTIAIITIPFCDVRPDQESHTHISAEAGGSCGEHTYTSTIPRTELLSSSQLLLPWEGKSFLSSPPPLPREVNSRFLSKIS